MKYFLVVKSTLFPVSVFTKSDWRKIRLCDPEDATAYGSVESAKNTFYDLRSKSEALDDLVGAYILDESLSVVASLTL